MEKSSAAENSSLSYRDTIVFPKAPPTNEPVRQNVLALIANIKASPCKDCGGRFHPEAMEFDHRDNEEKKFDISKARGYSASTVFKELQKCDLVCANCHRVRTSNRRSGLPAVLPAPEYFI